MRLHEKGGKEHYVPCHHNLDHFLDEYIVAADIAVDAIGYLFRTTTPKCGTLLAVNKRDKSVRFLIRSIGKNYPPTK